MSELEYNQSGTSPIFVPFHSQIKALLEHMSTTAHLLFAFEQFSAYFIIYYIGFQ